MKSKLICIFSKIKRSNKDVWYGYLTPSDILTLVELGVQPNKNNLLDYIKTEHSKGISNSHWFYFRLGKAKNHIPKELFEKNNNKH